MKFSKGDTVEVKKGIWRDEICEVRQVVGPNVFIKIPGVVGLVPFAVYELRHSQQKLDLEEANDSS